MVAVLALVIVFSALISGGVGALIASGKGRPGAGFLLGLFLGGIGWIIAALLDPTLEVASARAAALAELGGPTSHLLGHRPNGQLRQCPWCAELIQPAARICRFCDRDVHPSPSVAPPQIHAPLPPPEWITGPQSLPHPLRSLYCEEVIAAFRDFCAGPEVSSLAAFVQAVEEQSKRVPHAASQEMKSAVLGAAVRAGIDEGAARLIINEFMTGPKRYAALLSAG